MAHGFLRLSEAAPGGDCPVAAEQKGKNPEGQGDGHDDFAAQGHLLPRQKAEGDEVRVDEGERDTAEGADEGDEVGKVVGATKGDPDRHEADDQTEQVLEPLATERYRAVVELGEDLALGKPTDELTAANMLLRLRGRRHRVFSATGIQHEGNWDFFVESAVVEVSDYSDDDLVELVENRSWEGKAGAYDLAGEMGEFAQLVDGAEVCVLGFASSAIDELLRKI